MAKKHITYDTPACRAARQLCIERLGKCQDCPHAVPSLGNSCKIREMPEVAAAIGRAAYADKKRQAYWPQMITRAKLDREKVWKILDALAAGRMGRDIAREFEVHETSITKIKTGRIWPDVRAAWQQAQQGKAE